MVDNYLIRCTNGYWVLGEPCVTDHLKASRVRYLSEAKETAEALNRVGYCGGNCTVWQIEAQATPKTDKATGLKVNIVSHIPKKYGT